MMEACLSINCKLELRNNFGENLPRRILQKLFKDLSADTM
jgi:hypothetical protein